MMVPFFYCFTLLCLAASTVSSLHNENIVPTNPCKGIPLDDGGVLNVTEPCLLTCSTINCTFPKIDLLKIYSGGALYFDNTKTSTVLRVRNFIVNKGGELHAGSQEDPFTSLLDIVLIGISKDQDNPSIPKVYVGDLPYSKVLLAFDNSKISIHGKPKTPWIKLIRTAPVGSTELVLHEVPQGWEVGDKLIVPTTGVLHEHDGQNEIVTFMGIKHGTTIAIKEELKYEHFGNSEYVNLNGEVGILSRNIRIMGDNSNDEHEECLQAMLKGFRDQTNVLKVRDVCYGGHTAYLRGSTVQIENVEMTRMGQATRIARYPIHWHLAANVGITQSFVKNNSIHETYQRCVTVHGTWGALVEGTVCYLTHGHSFYMEDGIEFNNQFVRNLAVDVRKGPMVCSDSQVGPSGFWITNPNNTFVDNMVVDSIGVGYWIISGGDPAKVTGPNSIGTNFWESSFADQTGGLVFNPSRNTFVNDPSIPLWITNQEQGRTPLKLFRGNGVRSSHRGLHIDGFITSSIPGEIGDSPHPPEDIHVFGVKDGTCNYFPASGYALPSGEGVHVYAPTYYDYNANGKPTKFRPAYSVIDKLHVSRCNDAWWSRSARINVTNSVFAHNWIGMTNHQPGPNFCPSEGNPLNPGLANNIIDSLIVGHGDDSINEALCRSGGYMNDAKESPAGIRHYDGAFWLWSTRWVNLTTFGCPNDTPMKSLPYSLVAGRQFDCNYKYQVQLHYSWPLGASPNDKHGQWQWALPGGHLPPPTPAPPPTPSPPTPPPTPSPPTPPPTPRPPPGKWNKTQCSMGQTGGADVREHVAVVFKGTQTGSYEGGLKYCQDCIVRCYLQQKQQCIGVSFNSDNGTCWYFSKIEEVVKGDDGMISAVLAQYVPPDIGIGKVVAKNLMPAIPIQNPIQSSSVPTLPIQNLVQLSSISSCRFSTGGVVDMTGTLDPTQPGKPTGYYVLENPWVPTNPGELAEMTVSELNAYHYHSVHNSSSSLSAGWCFQQIQNPNKSHYCSYCRYKGPDSC